MCEAMTCSPADLREHYVRMLGNNATRYHVEYLDLFLEFPGSYHESGLLSLLEGLHDDGRVDTAVYVGLRGMVKGYWRN
jgi:hypothetical protein